MSSKISQQPPLATITSDAEVVVNSGGTTYRYKPGFVTNVRSHGATGDGVTDDTAAIQAAIDAASAAGGGTVFLPPGTYLKMATSAAIQIKSNVHLVGAGQGATIIQYNDASGSGAALHNASGTAITNVSVRGITFAGYWQTDNSRGTQMIEVSDCDGISFHDVEVRDSRRFGIVCLNCSNVRVTDCYVHRTEGDGIALWDCRNVVVSGNTIEESNDDSISCHTYDTTAAPLRQGITITGNTITASQGIKVLGAKVLTISGNTLTRCFAYGLYVSYDTSFNQGNTPHYAISITGNTITDVFKRVQGGSAEQYYVRLGGGQQNAGAAAAAPGRNDPATGSVVGLFTALSVGSFQANDTDDTANASPGGYGLVFANNILQRTLPAVAAYSNWGFGQLFGATAGYVDPAVAAAELETDGLKLEGFWKHALIRGNVVDTTGDRGVFFAVGATPPALQFDDLVIADNIIADFGRFGIHWEASTVTAQNIVVRGNMFDGDPRLVHSNRGANGTWAASTEPSGVYLANASGFFVEGNHIKNVAVTVTEGGSAVNSLQGNTVRCDPAATGFSTSNKGVGNVPLAGARFRHEIEECDPNQVAFGQIKQVTLHESATIPAAGAYVRGHVVRSTSDVGPRAWYRLTTGSGHVEGSDWGIYDSGKDGVQGRGDADATAAAGVSLKKQLLNTPLTADRTITLSTANVWDGAEFEFIRTAASTGAFDWVIGGLKNLATGEWCRVAVEGGAWILIASGTV